MDMLRSTLRDDDSFSALVRQSVDKYLEVGETRGKRVHLGLLKGTRPEDTERTMCSSVGVSLSSYDWEMQKDRDCTLRLCYFP